MNDEFTHANTKALHALHNAWRPRLKLKRLNAWNSTAHRWIKRMNRILARKDGGK